MKFVRETPSAITIRHVEKGRLVIGDETVTESVMLYRDTIERGWPGAAENDLSIDDVSSLVAMQPEIIVYGTGWNPVLPPRELTFALARQGIGFEVMDTPAACRTFNILINEDRDVAAILRLT
jgi:uncharacterized protein